MFRFRNAAPGRKHGSFDQNSSNGCGSAPLSLSAWRMEWLMPRARRKLPKGIHIHESGSVYICYKNEHGKIIRENTHQSDLRAAELLLAQARTDVAMKRRFTSLSFERVKFIDLFNDWWSNHGSRTR